jgi:hypothetical protein
MRISNKRCAFFYVPLSLVGNSSVQLIKVLEQVIPLLASDQAVSIVPVGHLLTTREAAELLRDHHDLVHQEQRIKPKQPDDDFSNQLALPPPGDE